MRAGVIAEDLRALVVQLKGDDGGVAVLGVIGRRSLLDALALEDNVAVGILERQMRGRAHDAQDLVGILDVRNLDADAIAALRGDGRLGIALSGQSVDHNGDGGVPQRLEILDGRIALVDRVDAAAQIETQLDGAADRLDDVLAYGQAVDGQRAHQYDEQQRD